MLYLYILDSNLKQVDAAHGGGWGYSNPYYEKRFECLEKRYINVTNYNYNYK